MTFSPERPRSILKTRPETGALASPAGAGSSSAIPAISASTPAPVMAEPKYTGCTASRRVCAASAARRQEKVTALGSSTYAARRSSSCSASRSSRSRVPSVSSGESGLTAASRLPSPDTFTIGTGHTSSAVVMSCSSRWSCAPARSILFTKTSVGIRSRPRVRISTRVCACTPSTAETTRTAPSSTPRARSTSAMKSGCPGVSIRLTVTPPTENEATADLMVMPRCRSSSSVSVWVLPSSTLPISSMTPAAKRSRSVRLVLPASTCATIPKLTVCTRSHVLEVGDNDHRDGHESCTHVWTPCWFGLRAR